MSDESAPPTGDPNEGGSIFDPIPEPTTPEPTPGDVGVEPPSNPGPVVEGEPTTPPPPPPPGPPDIPPGEDDGVM